MKKRLVNLDGLDNDDIGLKSVYDVVEHEDGYHYYLMDDDGYVIKLARNRFEDMDFTTGPDKMADSHYNNTNGSLYLFAEQHNLNAWEFDIVKRIVRCRKKGHFKEDLEKTKRVIDLYLNEHEK